MVVSNAEWTCPTCSIIHTSSFCPTCGEEAVHAGHLTLRKFAAHIISELTSVDSRLVRSFRELLAHPGVLTKRYRDGQRKQYLLPINLFLLTNVIFFAVQSAASVKVFSTPLSMHLHNQFWSPAASYLVDARLHAAGTTLKALDSSFDRAVALNAKSLIGLMVPLFALLLPPVFARSKQPFVVHAVFALHTYSFVLLMLCLALIFLTGIGIVGLDSKSSGLDQALSVAQLVVLFAYLFASTRVVYGVRGVPQLISAFTLTAVAAALLLGYRFFLFVITLYMT